MGQASNAGQARPHGGKEHVSNGGLEYACICYFYSDSSSTPSKIPVGSVPYAEIMGHVATEEVTFTSFTKSFPTAIQRARSGRSMRQEFVSDPYAYANSSGHVSYRAEMKESVRSPGGEAPPYLFSNGIPQDFKQRMVAAIGPRAQKGGERPWPYALAALDERRSPSYGVERMQMPQVPAPLHAAPPWHSSLTNPTPDSFISARPILAQTHIITGRPGTDSRTGVNSGTSLLPRMHTTHPR